MAENAYTAVAEFADGDGKTWKVQFDYEARAAIRTSFGKAPGEALAEVAIATTADNLDPFARLLAIGLQRHHPGTGPEDIRRMSPPIRPTWAAMERAFMWSMFGEKGPPSETAENPPSKAL